MGEKKEDDIRRYERIRRQKLNSEYQSTRANITNLRKQVKDGKAEPELILRKLEDIELSVDILYQGLYGGFDPTAV